jgi:hypothetical protein
MEMNEYSKINSEEEDEETEEEAEAEAEQQEEKSQSDFINPRGGFDEKEKEETKRSTRRPRIYTEREQRKANKKQKPPAKIEMVEAITEYLQHRGQRMSNLKKASLETLNNLIIKYEIDINEFKEERQNRLKETREKKEKENKIYKENILKAEIEYKKEEGLYKVIKQTLTPEEHKELKEKYINQARKEEDEYFNNNQEKIKQAEKNRKKIGLDLIERMGKGQLSEDETYIIINGMNVMIDSVGTFKKKTDEHLITLYERNEKIILLELYERNELNLKNRVSSKYLFREPAIKKKSLGCFI